MLRCWSMDVSVPHDMFPAIFSDGAFLPQGNTVGEVGLSHVGAGRAYVLCNHIPQLGMSHACGTVLSGGQL